MKDEITSLKEKLCLTNSDQFPKIIRRDLPNTKSSKPRLVPWNGNKVERAVNAACAELGHEPVGKLIQNEIETRMKNQRPHFIHIEQLQDMVENDLIDLNYGRVGLAYGKHRARRAALRELEIQAAFQEEDLLEHITPIFIEDLRLRISFARIGLNLILSDKELTHRLTRSISSSLTAQELKETIILNAKSLLEVDADSRFFAGRILLTYIYEETLP